MDEKYFKSKKAFDGFSKCHSVMQFLAHEIKDWCIKNECTFLITETKTTDAEDRVLNRVSKTHQEGRAIDLSCREWKKENIEEFIAYFSHKYAHIAAVGMSGPRLIVHHDSGHGAHFHVQIRPNIEQV